jgi:hypothetical protein
MLLKNSNWFITCPVNLIKTRYICLMMFIMYSGQNVSKEYNSAVKILCSSAFICFGG